MLKTIAEEFYRTPYTVARSIRSVDRWVSLHLGKISNAFSPRHAYNAYTLFRHHRLTQPTKAAFKKPSFEEKNSVLN